MLFSEYKNHINLIECDNIKIFINTMLMEIFNPEDLSLVDKHTIDRFYKYHLYKHDPHTNAAANRDLNINNRTPKTITTDERFIPTIEQLKNTVKVCSPCIENMLKDKTAKVGDRLFLRNLPEKCYSVISIEDLKRSNEGIYIISCVLITYWGGGNDKASKLTDQWIDYNGTRCFKQDPTGSFSVEKGEEVYKPPKQKLSPELKAALRQRK